MKFSLISIVTFIILSFSPNAFSQCAGIAPDLGPDTTFCAGSSIVLSSEGTFQSYLWDNNSMQATRTVSQAGTYWLKTGTTTGNLIVNGDFEQGNSGFTTDYAVAYGAGPFGLLSAESTYTVIDSPSSAHDHFANCEDHTPGTGSKMMVVNGAGIPNTKVWCQTVAVDPNKEYQFSTWAASALNDPNVAELQFSINGSSLGAVFSPPSTSCDWRQFYQTWNSGIETNAEICIVNQNINDSGNDFMIDDISFAPVCYETDTIVVTTIAAPVITATPNDSICKGEISNIVASSANPNLTYTWNPGNITSPNLNVSPATSAFYNVTAVDENGCASNLVSRMVHVQASPVVNLQFSDTICAGTEVSITANATGSNLTYAWSPNLSTTNNLLDSPQTSTSYSVIVTNAIGCNAYDTANVYVIPTLTASIAGDLVICEGVSTVLTASGNQAGMDFVWSNGAIGNSITVPSTQAGSYFVTGSFYNCPAAEAEVTVVSQSIPQLTLPKDLMTCPGEPVSATVSSTTPGAIFNWLDLEETGDTKSITLLEGGFIYVTAQVGSCVSPIDSFYVGISANCFFDVPNVFTPNGDGVNDYFQLVDYSGISSLSCVILNRWGNVVASFDTPDFNWDGSDNQGNKLADGTYFYIIDAEDYASQPFKEHGSIQLVR